MERADFEVLFKRILAVTEEELNRRIFTAHT